MIQNQIYDWQKKKYTNMKWKWPGIIISMLSCDVLQYDMIAGISSFYLIMNQSQNISWYFQESHTNPVMMKQRPDPLYTVTNKMKLQTDWQNTCHYLSLVNALLCSWVFYVNFILYGNFTFSKQISVFQSWCIQHAVNCIQGQNRWRMMKLYHRNFQKMTCHWHCISNSPKIWGVWP